MADPFLCEIRMFANAQPPQGWAQCNGQLLPINQNQSLFALLGTTYGGNGQTNFALPDLRGRIPMHKGQNHILGEKGGEQAHTLSVPELPTHFHTLNAATSNADSPALGAGSLAAFNNGYRAATSLVALNPSSISNTGGSQAHQNMSPYIAINYCIALIGLFPTQN